MSQSGTYSQLTTIPIPVAQGGTGVATITDHSLIVGSGTSPITILAAAADGQIPIGSTGADPVIGNITSAGGTVTITNGAGTINLESAGAVPIQFDCDGGSAVPALGILTVAGGTNVTTAGAGSTVTVNLDAAITGTTSHDFATGGRIGTALLAGNTLTIDAYDVDGAAYVPFITLTANDTPTCDLSTDVTIGTAYIYRVGGTDVSVADGGTGASTFTDHGILLGSGAGAITALAEASDGQIPIGSTGNDPVLATVTGGNNIGITNAAGSITVNVNATTQYALQVGDATNSLDSLGLGTATQILQSGGAGANPAWSTATYPATSAQGDVLYSSAANTIVGLVKDATATRYLANTGATNNPAWDQVELTNGVSGTLPVGSGGTGIATITDHGVMVGSGVGAVTPLAVGTDGQVLLGSSAADPVFATLASSGSTITFTPGAGSLNLETGGAVAASFPTDVGTATPAVGALTVTGGTNINTAGAAAAVTVNLDAALTGTTSHDFAAGGRIGTATGAGNTLLLQAYDVDGTAYTTFATLTANNTPTMDLDDAVTKGGQYIYRAAGTDVPVTDGGTGSSSLTDHGVLVGSGATAVTPLAVGTDGQVLLGSSAADPVFATLTSTGSTITFTPGAGTLNLESVAAGGMEFVEATGATQAIAVNTGYTTNNGAQLDYTLPATAAVGDRCAIAGNSASGWTLSQNAGQTIHFISSDTTTGVAGALTSTNRYDCVEIVCVTANTDFVVRSSCGNITVT